MNIRLLILFGGMLVAGEVFMVPAVYASLIGAVSTVGVVATAVLATALSDSLWYLVGAFVPTQKVQSWPFIKKRHTLIATVNTLFDQYRLRWLFLSKFAYGTRTVTQVAMGIKRVPYFAYMAVNLLGVLSWIALMYAIGWITRAGLRQFELAVLQFQIILATLFLVIVVALLWVVHRNIKKRME